MQIVLLGGTAQPRDHWHHLGRWWERPANTDGTPMLNAVYDRHERIVGVERPGPPQADGPFERVARAIMRYDVFPPWVGSGLLRQAPVQVGDAVGMRYRLLPGVELIFASRVLEVIQAEDRRGFTYRTLDGHPEKGEETFLVCKNLETGEVRASLNAWSGPGWRLTALTYPLARRLQLAAGRGALDHLETIAQS